ncbi:MAG TPA: hypothetical protein VG248_03345 [Caulobacteraceae bacterium]|jgi:hypothetical protein|nr:hypothetical protein [Caulobacteraceae bacterium]
MSVAALVQLALIAGFAVVNVPFLLHLFTRNSNTMALSQAFTDALNNLVAGFNAEVAAKQAQIDALTAQVNSGASDAAQVDAEATAALVAATPAAS